MVVERTQPPPSAGHGVAPDHLALPWKRQQNERAGKPPPPSAGTTAECGQWLHRSSPSVILPAVRLLAVRTAIRSSRTESNQPGSAARDLHHQQTINMPFRGAAGPCAVPTLPQSTWLPPSRNGADAASLHWFAAGPFLVFRCHKMVRLDLLRTLACRCDRRRECDGVENRLEIRRVR